MIKRLVPIAVVALSGCATFSDIDKGMAALVGQPISAAEARLGVASSEQQVGGKHVYVWGRDFNMSMPTTNTSSVNGTVNGHYYRGTVTTTGSQQVNYNCTLRFITDQSDRIISYDWQGNLGGCYGYGSALKPAKGGPVKPGQENPGPAQPSTRGKDNKDG